MNSEFYSQRAFETAIRRGVFSLDPNAENSPGHYMYMGDCLQQWSATPLHSFKHIDTRQYVYCEKDNARIITGNDYIKSA